jgi:hypothetical protein
MTSSPKETTTKVEPWDGAKPYLLDQYKKANDLFNSGAPKPYEGSTVAAQSQATKDALANAEKIARGGDTSTLTNASNAVNNILNQNGQSQSNSTLSQLQNPASFGTNPVNSIASQIANGQTPQAPGTYNQNYTNPAAAQAAGYSGYTNSANGLQTAQANSLANNSNPALEMLKNTANGSNIGRNSYLDSMVSQSQDSIANKLKNVTNPGIDSQAASLGRMNSAAYATQRNNAESTAANEMAKVATDMYGNQYNQDVQNQLSSAAQYGQLSNADVSNRLQSNQALSQTDSNQQQQRLAGSQLYGNLNDAQQTQRTNAANSMNNQFNANRDYQMQGLNLSNNAYQQNIQNMLGLNDQRMNAANSQLGQQNSLNSQQLQAASQAGGIYGNQYLPSQQLAGIGGQKDAYADLLKQAEVNAFDRKEQQPVQNVQNMINMLNGGGYSNTTTPVYSNTAGQVMGGLSSLAGLFALCDATTKVLHKVVGEMPLINGETLPIYEFHYCDDADQKIWVGPVAQELAAANANAVVDFDGRKHIKIDELIRSAA